MKIKFDKNDPLLTEEIKKVGPENTGTLGSKDSFVQETLYQINEKIPEQYKNILLSFKNYYHHYGRINNKILSIEPNEAALESIGEENSVFVFNFVANAYRAMNLEIQLLKQKGAISKKSPVYNFSAVGEKIDLETMYQSYFNNIYLDFFNFVNEKKYKKNIVDFNSFLDIFLRYVDDRTPNLVFNKSTFCYSKFCSPNINGLTINLLQENILDDKNKYNNYLSFNFSNCLNEPTYQTFLNIAENYGFYVNKDIPWQIVANLDSPRMKYYFKLQIDNYVNQNILQTNPIDCQENSYEDCRDQLENFDLKNYLFNSKKIKFYNIINNEDITILKRTLGRIYNGYVKTISNVKQSEIKRIDNKLIIENKNINLEFLNIFNLLENNLDNNWIKYYIFIKAKEHNLPWDQKKFNYVVQKTLDLATTLDISEAMVYLQGEINKNKISKAKQTNFTI